MGGTIIALKSVDIDIEVFGGLTIAGLFPEANVHSSFFHKTMIMAVITVTFIIIVVVIVVIVVCGEHCS